ncbi:MAG: NUDIX hydrolase [Rhizobiaceae bacterium]
MHRVGIMPFDIAKNAVALLFVTSQTRGRWIVPKGLIKDGESHTEACQREAFEEAGVEGVVFDDFPMTVTVGKRTDSGLEQVPVTYYPMLVTKQLDDWPENENRERHWALLQNASKVVHRDDYLVLIRQFERLIPWLTKLAAHHKPPQQAEPTPAL